MQNTQTPKFSLGAIRASTGALWALGEAHLKWEFFVNRHQIGEWGIVDPEGRARNEEAVRCGGRILSIYVLPTGEAIWIITDTSRRTTVLMLPCEY